MCCGPAKAGNALSEDLASRLWNVVPGKPNTNRQGPHTDNRTVGYIKSTASLGPNQSIKVKSLKSTLNVWTAEP